MSLCSRLAVLGVPPGPRRARCLGRPAPTARSSRRRIAAIGRETQSPRRLSYAALLVAAGLTGVYAETIPNFEVLTLVVFCAGVLLGARGGAGVGILTMTLYSLLNPYGPAHPLVTVSQVVGMAVAGWAGALVARLGVPERPARSRAAILGAVAVPLTAFYDLVTNLATGVILGQIRVILVLGIPFSLWHIGYNVALFVALGTPLVAVCGRYAARLSS